MAQIQTRKTQSEKIEEARDQQSKLYREIGISAVAAALRFAGQPEGGSAPGQVHPMPASLRGELAA